MSKATKESYQSEEGDRGEGNGALSWRSRTWGGTWLARARVREKYPAHLGSSHDQACAEKYLGRALARERASSRKGPVGGGGGVPARGLGGARRTAAPPRDHPAPARLQRLASILLHPDQQRKRLDSLR